jgi:dihydropyrimidine dehydrogenase (NAD+) subunit PreA
VIDEECVGCNLCLHVCPVENCITMREIDNGKPFLTWKEDPRNPMNQKAAE